MPCIWLCVVMLTPALCALQVRNLCYIVHSATAAAKEEGPALAILAARAAAPTARTLTPRPLLREVNVSCLTDHELSLTVRATPTSPPRVVGSSRRTGRRRAASSQGSDCSQRTPQPARRSGEEGASDAAQPQDRAGDGPERRVRLAPPRQQRGSIDSILSKRSAGKGESRKTEIYGGYQTSTEEMCFEGLDDIRDKPAAAAAPAGRRPFQAEADKQVLPAKPSSIFSPPRFNAADPIFLFETELFG